MNVLYAGSDYIGQLGSGFCYSKMECKRQGNVISFLNSHTGTYGLKESYPVSG